MTEKRTHSSAESCGLDERRFTRALEAYWDAVGGTDEGLRAALVSYLTSAPAQPAPEPSDGAIYAAVSMRDITPEEKRLIEKALLDGSAELYPLEPVSRSSAGNARLSALASRIAEIEPTWLPIAGHVRNVTFTLDEADMVIAALTAAEPQASAGNEDRLRCRQKLEAGYNDLIYLQDIGSDSIPLEKAMDIAELGLSFIDALNEPQGVPETFRLDATNRVLRKALKHIAGQRWNEKETVQHICDYAENILEREDAANKPQQVEVSITELRQTVEDAIRTFCQSLGVGAVTISSDGVERIYYAGINLKALSVAVTLALPRPHHSGETP